MKMIINESFNKILIPILWIYEKFFMYRLKEAWGRVHLRNIKNKGVGNEIVGYSRFLDPDHLKIGSHIRIGYGCFFFCKGGIEIDDYTIISRNVTIYSANHNYKSDFIPFDDRYICKPVRIGRAVWIGMNVCILPGVHIGDGAIIGMGTIVARDVAPGEIIGTAASRLIGSRDMVQFDRAMDNKAIFALHFR